MQIECGFESCGVRGHTTPLDKTTCDTLSGQEGGLKPGPTADTIYVPGSPIKNVHGCFLWMIELGRISLLLFCSSNLSTKFTYY